MTEEYDFDSLLDDLVEPESKEESDASWNAVDAVDAVDAVVNDEVPASPKIPESMMRKKVVKKLEQDPAYAYSNEFKEIQDGTLKYLREYFDVESRMRELKEELKEIKEEAKEEGVPINNVSKAIKSLVAELKETSVDAQSVEESKRFIKADDDLYSNIVVMSQ